ncbi:MAG: antitoxin family protein [Pirellulales bacterium]
MKFITAVYEQGVFRPTAPVDLPEGTTVVVQPATESLNVRDLAPPGTADEQLRIYECLARSYETGDPNAAARHDEHQP